MNMSAYTSSTSPIHLFVQVMWCCSGSGQVWVGLASGQILVYQVSPYHAGGDLKATLTPTTLLAHTAPIMHMYVSDAFSVCVSGGKDGMCVLWDTNRYVVHKRKAVLCEISRSYSYTIL